MKLVPLIFANLLRNRRRSLLTFASLAVSLFLVATLLTVLTELEEPPETPASALRLICRHRVSMSNFLPKSYRQRIARIGGVEAVLGSTWFGGVYRDPKNFFAQFAVDADRFFEIYADVDLPEGQKQDFIRDRTGAIAGDRLAAKYGWELGRRITLQGTRFDFDPELTLRGIYRGGGDDGSILYFHWDYLNEAVQGSQAPYVDAAGFFIVRARSGDEAPRVAEAIDAAFRDSAAPTRTETEQAFVLGHVAVLGNVRFLVAGISLVVVFTIVLVAANTMAMALRERTREIGILKALGFKRRQVLALVLGESVLLSLAGSLAGALGARFIYSQLKMTAVTIGMVQRFTVTPGTLGLCAGIGLVVGLLAAGLPAWRAASLPVVDALREP